MRLFLLISAVILAPLLSFGQVDGYRIDGRNVVFEERNGAKLSLMFCSPSVIRVWYAPGGDLSRTNPSFAVVDENLGDPGEIRVDEQASAFEIYTSALRVRIDRDPMRLQIFDKWQKLVFGDYAGRGHEAVGERGVKARKILRSDEHFFGLGEKTGPLDRRGRSYRMWNSDRPCYGVTEDPLCKSIPFFMSSYRYGIFLDNTYKTEFEFGTESDEYYSFRAPGGAFIYYFIFGADYKEILTQYIALTGKPIMPPEWAFGFSQSRGLYTRQDQAVEVADGFRSRGIPCDVIYQDIGWTQYLQDFEWREGNYHSPEKMTDYLKRNGFRMIVSQDPVVSQRNTAQWREADSLGYFVKDVRTGASYDMPWPWGGNCGVVDFTLPQVADWWGEYQQKPLDDGVAGFWTDMGEPAWSNEEDTDRLNMNHRAGMHEEIHNVYGLTWDKVVTEQFNKRNPNRRVFQMTRSAYAGLQRYTFGWTADSGNGDDVLEGWGQFANQVQVGISAGLGGIPFWTTDISGYCGDIKDHAAMAELYTRWMQFGVFCPLSRAHHEGNNAVEPWMFGDEAERNAKSAIELKYTLFPYIYTYARTAHDTGLPITRGLFMEFPGDPAAVATEDQFMFGEELLVAPVLKKGERTRELYLPKGEWVDFGDKSTVYRGGTTISYDAPLDVIPMFVKRGSIVPRMPVMQYIHENPDYPLTVDIFPARKRGVDGKASFRLYEDEGEDLGYLEGVCCLTDFVCETTGSGYDISIKVDSRGFRQSEKRYFELLLHIESKPDRVVVTGERIRASSRKSYDTFRSLSAWSWDEESRTCKIRIPDDRDRTDISVITKQTT